VLVLQIQPKHVKDVKAAAALESPDPLTHFATTRWSLFSQGDDPGAPGARTDANANLAQLCRIYWRPIFRFILRRGYLPYDAQDLTQDFFLMILEGRLIQSADPERGRFRSLLMKSLENFLVDAESKRFAEKRGGGVQFVSWEGLIAKTASDSSIAVMELESAPPQTNFDLGWAATVAEEALRRLRMECESKGRRRVFEVLQGHLSSERCDTQYDDLSKALGVPESTMKGLLFKFRKRYRALLREEVAKTVEDEANVDDEIRYLCATLSAGIG
jgi:RNA polymerase sigma-70 factor (ECF subfamily)